MKVPNWIYLAVIRVVITIVPGKGTSPFFLVVSSAEPIVILHDGKVNSDKVMTVQYEQWTQKKMIVGRPRRMGINFTSVSIFSLLSLLLISFGIMLWDGSGGFWELSQSCRSPAPKLKQKWDRLVNNTLRPQDAGNPSFEDLIHYLGFCSCLTLWMFMSRSIKRLREAEWCNIII